MLHGAQVCGRSRLCTCVRACVYASFVGMGACGHACVRACASSAYGVHAILTVYAVCNVMFPTGISADVGVPHGYTCPSIVNNTNWFNKNKTSVETFAIAQSSTLLSVKRTDRRGGWDLNLKIRCDRGPSTPALNNPQKHNMLMLLLSNSSSFLTAVESCASVLAHPEKCLSSNYAAACQLSCGTPVACWLARFAGKVAQFAPRQAQALSQR